MILNPLNHIIYTRYNNWSIVINFTKLLVHHIINIISDLLFIYLSNFILFSISSPSIVTFLTSLTFSSISSNYHFLKFHFYAFLIFNFFFLVSNNYIFQLIGTIAWVWTLLFYMGSYSFFNAFLRILTLAFVENSPNSRIKET